MISTRSDVGAHVSVVTVVKDDPEGLEKTIGSVLAQDWPNIEFLIIDGASAEATLNVIRKYESRISHWQSEPDQGIYDAMNKGAALAMGEWLIFMNAGDVFYEPSVLRSLMSDVGSKTQVLMGGVEEVLTDEIETRHFRRTPGPLVDIWKHLPTSHQAILVKTEQQQKHRFDTRYRWCADQDSFARMYRAGAVFQSVDTLVCIYDCAGGRARDPLLFIKERWALSRGLTSFPQRLCFFGKEWLHCRVWGFLVKGIKHVVPDSWLIQLRKFRGTAGNTVM